MTSSTFLLLTEAPFGMEQLHQLHNVQPLKLKTALRVSKDILQATAAADDGLCVMMNLEAAFCWINMGSNHSKANSLKFRG